MRFLYLLFVLLSLPQLGMGQRLDSAKTRIKRQGFFAVGSNDLKPFTPILAYQFNKEGGLTIGEGTVVAYFDWKGSPLPNGPFQFGSKGFNSKRIAFAMKNDSIGAIDRKGNVVVPFRFQALEHSDHPYGWLRARQHGKWGLIDTVGQFRAMPVYDEIQVFSDGLAAVKLGDKWGFVDLSGQMVISPSYTYVRRGFHEGFAAVERSTQEGDNAVGFIDKRNRPITAFKYAFPLCLNRNNPHFRDWTPYYQFEHGIALVRNDKCEIGAIDTSGREVLPIRFYRVEITDSTVVGYRRKEQVTYFIPR